MKKIVDDIFDIEKELDLFQYQINGVYFWKLIRVMILSKLVENENLYEQKKYKFDKKNFIKSVSGNTIKNICFKNKKVDTIFFISNRIKEENGKNQEIYTEDLWEKEKASKQFISTDYIENFFTKDICYENDMIYISKLILDRKFRKKVIDTNAIEIIKTINSFFEKKYQVKELVQYDQLNKLIGDFLFKKKYYFNLFAHKKVEKIYLVCSYGREHIIAAAQELNIKVIEIQHGVMDEFHLGYNFPDKEVIPYFPDEIYLFGKYWGDNTNLPVNTKKIEYGYPHLSKQLSKYENVGKIKNQVLFISQHTIGTSLVEKAIEFAKTNPNFQIIYRLHPNEFSAWKEWYPQLLTESENNNNLIVIDNNNMNLYEQIMASRYIFGVYSTVLYEAIECKKNVGIIEYPSAIRMKRLVLNKNAVPFSPNEKIELAKFEKINKKNEKGYFFK